MNGRMDCFFAALLSALRLIGLFGSIGLLVDADHLFYAISARVWQFEAVFDHKPLHPYLLVFGGLLFCAGFALAAGSAALAMHKRNL